MNEHERVAFGNVRLSTGPRLHYAERGSPDGAPVVFLHGWPDSWFTFSRVLEILPPRLRALAIDQRGFGDSERPQAGHRIEDFAGDVVAFLDAMSIERAMVVGHSFGSFVARSAAILHPERVDRLVLIGTGFTSVNAVTREVQASLRDVSDPISREFVRDFQASTAHRPVPGEFFERILDESLKLPAALWRETFDRLLEYDDSSRLSALTTPTLLLWGDRDGLFSRADQERLLATLPNVHLRVFSDAGHCPNWEVPAEVTAALSSFVAPFERPV